MATRLRHITNQKIKHLDMCGLKRWIGNGFAARVLTFLKTFSFTLIITALKSDGI